MQISRKTSRLVGLSVLFCPFIMFLLTLAVICPFFRGSDASRLDIATPLVVGCCVLYII